MEKSRTINEGVEETESRPVVPELRRSTRKRKKSAYFAEFDVESDSREEGAEDRDDPSFQPEEIDDRDTFSLPLSPCDNGQENPEVPLPCVESSKDPVQTEAAPHHVNMKTENSETNSKLSRSQSPKNKPCVCDECGKVFVSHPKLNKHIRRVHRISKTPMPCPACKAAFSKPETLWNHFQDVHGAGIWQTRLSTRAPAKPRKTPVFAIDGTQSTVCDHCGKEFNSAMSLHRHVHLIHGTGALAQNFMVCAQCGKSFKTQESLNQHIRQVHEGIDFRCDICNRMCQSPGKLWRHKVEVHEITDLPPPPRVTVSTCEYCNQTFLRGLEVHVRTCHPEHFEQFQENIKANLNLKLKDQKGLRGTISLTPNALKKREQRALLKEKGPEAVLGLVPKWMLPKECPVCKQMISENAFSRHVQSHGTNTSMKINHQSDVSESVTQRKGVVVDTLKVV